MNYRSSCKVALLLSIFCLNGCVGMMADRFANNLGQAILNQNDPLVVKEGAPAYLLLLDSLVLEAPDNSSVLQASATLYGTYAAVFVKDEARAGRMAQKAREQSRRAMCGEYARVCELEKKPLPEFSAALKRVKKGDVDLLFTYGSTWAVWIQTHKDDWNAVAELPRIEAIMKRIIEIDENYEWGRAHLYLGVIKSQLPATLGGQPEQGRHHFEQAIRISDSRDLIAKVEFAHTYARLLFDQELHDRLLHEVVAADPDVKGLTLSNRLAQQQAQQLLETSTEYFEE